VALLLGLAPADASAGKFWDFVKDLWSRIWHRPPSAPVRVPDPGKRYWRLRFVDDFRGRPSESARDRLCYDQLSAQCHIWPGGDSYRCDLAHLAPTDAGPFPPLKENFAAAIGALDSSRNWFAEPLATVKARYSELVAQNLRHLDKCTWTLYHMLNWMGTDYQGSHSSKFDPTRARVLPQGKGYLELSAVKAPVTLRCAFGGTLVQPGTGLTPGLCKLLDLPQVQLVSGVRYWVDADERWPGVYYAQIGGGCPHGGSGGANCQLWSFEKGVLEPGVNYSVSAQGGTSAVFYLDVAHERCRDNIVYLPNGGVRFRNLACPILNGGMLSMAFNPAPAPGGGTSPARGFTQHQGRFEVKMRIVKGSGAFPAAWLMPTQGGWPYSGGEIDVLEARDNADEVYQTYHHGKCYRENGSDFLEAVTYWDQAGVARPVEPGLCGGQTLLCVKDYRTAAGPAVSANRACGGSLFDLRGYRSVNVSVGHTEKEPDPRRPTGLYHRRDHVFSVEWTPSRIDYLVNNARTHTVQVGTLPTGNYATGGGQATLPAGVAPLQSHNFPANPFYWILNHSTWVAPDKRPGFAPQRIYLDWVKTYSFCSAPLDFCPCGGTFVEGTGCTLAVGVRLSCPAGEPMPQIRTVGGQRVYDSPCRQIRHDCPNGGERAGPNCAVRAIAAGQLRKLVKYWVDADPRWPGVYYKQVLRRCPYGGAVSGGGNCQLLAFPADLLETGIDYWVEKDPRWPGVYYRPDFRE
jgi:hypothetical protein